MTSAANNTSASQQSPDDIERGSSSPTTDHEKPSTPGEKGNQGPCTPPKNGSESALKALGWLDRLLALWIFLAMAIGIILGNFVDDVGPALKKGKFVGVSIPIGTFAGPPFLSMQSVLTFLAAKPSACWS